MKVTVYECRDRWCSSYELSDTEYRIGFVTHDYNKMVCQQFNIYVNLTRLVKAFYRSSFSIIIL